MPILYNNELFYKGNKLNITKYLLTSYGYYYFFFRQWIWRVLKDTEGPCQRIDGVCYEAGSRIFMMGYGHRWNVTTVTSTPVDTDDYTQQITGMVVNSYAGYHAGLIDYTSYYVDDLISPRYVYYGSSNSGSLKYTWSSFKTVVNNANKNIGIGGGNCEFWLVGSVYHEPSRMNALVSPTRVAL